MKLTATLSLTCLCLLTLLLYACRTGEPIFPRDHDSPELVRQQLHDRMNSHRRIRYSGNWDVLAAGSRTSGELITLFYSRQAIDSMHRASGRDMARNDYWNREHIWPRSFGLKGTVAQDDLHNLVPVDRTINSSRGNKPYRESSRPHAECGGCLDDTDSWEPPDIVKGDVARIAFYMAVRYNGEGDEPELTLSDKPDVASARFGHLSTLIRWHCADPVSDEERRRHEAIAGVQKNRNVFIDEPVLAQEAFGFECEISSVRRGG